MWGDGIVEGDEEMNGWPARAVLIPKIVLGKMKVKKSSWVKSQRLQRSL